jgi:hypothetical protein
MRTFAQKPKATQQTASPRSTIPGHAHLHQSRAENEILQLQRTLGNQAVQRLLSENRGEVLGESTATTPTRFGHDFSQIPVHAPSTGAKGAEPAAVDGVPLPSGVRAAMEASFGEALDDVRLHGGPAAHRSARALGARAYTTGRDIVLGEQISMAEVNDPRSHLLTHELTHVLQHRRAGNQGNTDRIVTSGGAAEREAKRNSWLNIHGLPVGTVRTATEAVALTPTSDSVEYDLSYAANDWAVTAAEERRILDALDRDADLSATITDLKAAGMLGALFDRIDEPGNRRRLLHILGRGLSAAARALVEPYVRRLGTGAELQFNLGRFGVTSAAPAFSPGPLEAAVVGTARTSRTGHAGGHLTDPFTGVGATGVIPVTRDVGTFYSTPGVPQIPLTDQALLAAGHAGTVATYSNPLPGSLSAYLSGLSATTRTQQAELLLRWPIASVEARSYGGNLPSRAQVITAAARAHALHGALVAAFILAEQRDQSQAEDAKDYQGATSIMQGNTSIGLGQVVVSTARNRDLFADLISAPTRTEAGLNRTSGPGHHATARLLASDEYNIFAVARYIRQVADRGSGLSLAALPNTAATYPGISLPAYAGNSSTWPDDNIRALGSEYTSTAWDDRLVPAWGEFVYQAYRDVLATGLV